MKKYIALNIFIITIILTTIYVPTVTTDAEEQIIIPNIVTEEIVTGVIDNTLSDDIVKVLSVDIDTTNKVNYNYVYEVSYGLLTETMLVLPLDDDYCDISECSIYSVFTEEELDLLFRVVEAETYGWGYENHRNVANVIFNRLKTGWNDGTLKGILTAKNQFAVVTTGFYKMVNVSTETILAVEDAWTHDYTNGAVYFNKNTTKSYASIYCQYLFTDSCGHDFYKEK